MQGTLFDETEFFRAIMESGARALLIGRRAMIALGIPVMTSDYDFWLFPEDIEPFNEAVLPMGLVPTQSPADARAKGRYVLENDERVDVLVARRVGTVELADLWTRRHLLALSSGAQAVVPSLEDLIATKRFGGRPKDAQDILLLEVLKEQHK